jgi:hypothetical protein
MHGWYLTGFWLSTTMSLAVVEGVPDLPKEEAVALAQMGEVPISPAQVCLTRTPPATCRTPSVSKCRWVHQRPLQLLWTGTTRETTLNDVFDMILLGLKAEVCSEHMRSLAHVAAWNIQEPLPVGAHRSKICASKFRIWVSLLVRNAVVSNRKFGNQQLRAEASYFHILHFVCLLLCEMSVKFLRACAKLRKATINFVISVRPSVCLSA